MKTQLTLLIILASLLASASAFAENAATNTPPATIQADANADEIDLEEMDDSADAAKAPQIKKTEEENGTATLVDITCDNATLEDILRQFRKVTDANIISDDSTNLQRRVSVNLHHVPWLSGLQSILNSRNYRLEERGDIYFVKEDKVAEPILTRTFELNHASARELTELFNQSYGKKDAKGAVIVPVATCFEGANVVVVTAIEKIITDCESIIKAVDKAVAQIYIEARFLELSTEAMHKLGLQWNSLESWGVSAKNLSADFSISSARTTADGYTVAQTLSGNASHDRTSTHNSLTGAKDGNLNEVGYTSSDASSVSGSFSRNGDRNHTKNTANDVGFSGQLSADDFRLALSAFEELEDARIFSNPKVIVSNGKEATVDMTTKFPNVKLTSQRNMQSDNAYLDMSAELTEIPGERGHKELQYKDKALFAGSCFYEWGITLSVKPRISPDGLISVEIVPAISQLDLETTDTGFYDVKSDNTFGLFPIIAMKRIITDFTMKDGSTAVIGGLSRTVEEDVDSGIPYLRKLPWIGQRLFGWKSRQKVQKEIVVCVTIGIANPAELPKDIGLPTNAVMGREYMTGAKLEPGKREGNAATVLRLDMRDLDDKEREAGEVEIKKAD